MPIPNSTNRRRLILASCLVLLGAAQPAWAEPVTVKEFLRSTFTVYDANGTGHSATPADFDHPPLKSVGVGPANSIGLRTLKNEVVYIRRLDVRLDGPIPCLAGEQAAARGPNEQEAGSRMGAGASHDCSMK